MRTIPYSNTLPALLAGMLLALACMHAAAQQEPAPATVELGAPIAASQLSRLRGGTDTVNDMRLHGTTAGNTAQDVQTGSNAISDGAFAHLSGIPVVVQNTGANVLIQNAVIVNVRMQ